MLNLPVLNANYIGQWLDKSESGCAVKYITSLNKLLLVID